jgi:hypothetical protein
LKVFFEERLYFWKEWLCAQLKVSPNGHVGRPPAWQSVQHGGVLEADASSAG